MHERAVCASRPRPAYAASCARILYTPHLARDRADASRPTFFLSVSSGLPAITTTHICDRVMDLGNRLGQEPTQHTRQHRRTDATLTDRPLLITIVIPCSAYKNLDDFEQSHSVSPLFCSSPLHVKVKPRHGAHRRTRTRHRPPLGSAGLDHSSSLTHTHISCSAITHRLNLLEQIFRASVHRPSGLFTVDQSISSPACRTVKVSAWTHAKNAWLV